MLSKLAFVLAVILPLATFAVAHDSLAGYTFRDYVRDYARSYNSAEYKHREALFNARIASVRAHNADATQTYKRGVNHFSDWSDAEFKAYNTLKITKPTKAPTKIYAVEEGDATGIAHTVDYRNSVAPSVLTAVKNQGACGNCWAHSSTESIESFFSLLTGQLPVLSTQQITSCTESMYGCGGGSISQGWDYVAGTTGLNEEWLYPFVDFFVKHESKNATAPCRNITKDFLPTFPWWPKAGVTGYSQVRTNDAYSTLHTLSHVGPLSISVAASTWMDYAGGIFANNASKGKKNWEIDHAVQLVGYGTDLGLQADYWIVRNSWGTEWGEQGYIRLLRTSPEPCGEFMGMTVCGTSALLYNPEHPVVKQLSPKNP